MKDGMFASAPRWFSLEDTLIDPFLFDFRSTFLYGIFSDTMIISPMRWILPVRL